MPSLDAADGVTLCAPARRGPRIQTETAIGRCSASGFCVPSLNSRLAGPQGRNSRRRVGRVRPCPRLWTRSVAGCAPEAEGFLLPISAEFVVYLRDRRRPSTLVGRGEHGKTLHEEPPWGALWPDLPGRTVTCPVNQSQRDPNEVFVLVHHTAWASTRKTSGPLDKLILILLSDLTHHDNKGLMKVRDLSIGCDSDGNSVVSGIRRLNADGYLLEVSFFESPDGVLFSWEFPR